MSTADSVNDIVVSIMTYMEKLGRDFHNSDSSLESGVDFFKYYLASEDNIRPLGVRNIK